MLNFRKGKTLYAHWVDTWWANGDVSPSQIGRASLAQLFKIKLD